MTFPANSEIFIEANRSNSHYKQLRRHTVNDFYTYWHHGYLREFRYGKLYWNSKLKTSQSLIRVVNLETFFCESDTVKTITKSARNKTIRIETFNKFWCPLLASEDEILYTIDGWKLACDLKENDYLYLLAKKNKYTHKVIPSKLRQGINEWTYQQRKYLILPEDYCYICNQKFRKEHLDLDHVIPVIADLKLALDINNLKPACEICHSAKSKKEIKLQNNCQISAVKPFKIYKIQTGEVSDTFEIQMTNSINLILDGYLVKDSKVN